jgi:hypothetical protein
MTPRPRAPRDRLARTTKLPLLRTRAQMSVLAAEPGLKVPQMARLVRASPATGLRWRKRHRAEGLAG